MDKRNFENEELIDLSKNVVKNQKERKANKKIEIENQKNKINSEKSTNKKNNNSNNIKLKKNRKYDEKNRNQKNRKSKNIHKNSKKQNKKVEISAILIGLTIFIFFIYSIFGRGYIEDIKRDDFINMIEPIAVDVYEKYGIYPSVTISRAAVESNWGKSELSKEGFNLFGIKADKSWNGRKINMMTKENYNNTENAAFRKYRSYKESIFDYGKFLNENKRYEKAGLFKAKSGKEQAQILENAGYATKENSDGEPVYADILIDFMNRYKLEKIDLKYQKK
ncbi:glycoside hydrolase family 73 protein [Peptacetobacter sp.]|uniref:glycoside hydrolase family 73 protein n=1 Tax=Peptacetobacter sp. TaxID=2991975 RepID=UPI002617A44C|nr:glucosaminidase domain-containing protein [Peptacetobacter sp.]